MVPKSVYANTGEASEAYEEIRRFFVAIASDDKLHALLFQEEVIAAVTETRTFSNNVRFNFFTNLSDLI